MRKTMRCGSWAVSIAIASAVLSAGCKDECHVGDSECISNALIQTCVPSEDGNEWLVHQCGANERCRDNTSAGRDGGSESDAGGDSGAGDFTVVASGGASCVGTCEIGEHSCVTPMLARVCITGGQWQLSPCAVGQTCERAGACVVGSGENTVKACKPGAKACASEQVEKVCDADGTAWIEQPCASNESCQKDACAPDPKSSCDDDNTCLDNKTAVRCLGGDDGFQLVKCDGDLYCEAGRCRGAVCAVGSLCTTGNQLRECVDGKSYRDSQCGVNEACQQIKDTAKCVPLQCVAGTSACGDPRDPTVDARKRFTTCTVSAGGSGVPEWAKGECAGNTTCNPTLSATANPCSQTCTKGAQRCTTDAIGGVNEGFQTCGDDGKWGPTQTCNSGNESSRQCVLAPNPNASVLPKALCAEPVCWWTFSNMSAHAEGACEGDQLRKCQMDGTLAEPGACTQGVCRNVNEVVTGDGHTPAMCETMPQCETGEEQCLTAGNNATPRYRTCENGFFGAEIKTCENDGACFNARDAKGKRKKVCGAECSPGAGRCNDDGELEKCDAEGHWARGEQCDMGRCRTMNNNDASCVLDCVPGTSSCTGSNVTAPDGYHQGKSQQRVCQNDGVWAGATNCTDGRVCRVTASGVGLGCVACIGPMATGGNSENTADSRCDPNDDTKIQDCGDNDSWLSARTCSDGKSCVAPISQSCGMCMGANSMMQCTDGNLRNEQVCASCDVPLMGGGMTTITACTQSAISGTANTAATMCTQINGGSIPGNWGGQSDCCGGFQRTAFQVNSNATCNGRGFGAPVNWGGVSDCCNASKVGANGTTFAYCD
jgi:hypothetical protein